jgi:hypothetical protein
MSACDWKLNALVLADRGAKDFAVAGIAAGAIDEPARIADTLGGNKNTFGVLDVEDF